MLQAKRQELAAAGQKKLASAVLVQRRMSALDTVAAQFHLQDLARGSQDKPCANPHWWGAFQCVGAGWKPKGDSLEA